MAKSTTLSAAQWIFLLAVIWGSTYYAGVMTRHRLSTIPGKLDEPPGDLEKPVEPPGVPLPVGWLPPQDEIRQRPARPDLEAWEKYRGKAVAGIVAEIRGSERETPDAPEFEGIRIDDAKGEIETFPEFSDQASGAGLVVVADTRINGGGNLGVFDLDGDGHLDVQTAARPGQPDLQLFRNRADGLFEKVSEPAGPDPIATGSQITAADYDNDGDLDLFVVRERLPNSLLENGGDGNFEDVTERAGLLDFRWTASAEWVDFDRDGWIDLFVAHNPGNYQSEDPSCRLFHNQGDGAFREIGWETGLRFSVYVRDCAWGDLDADGFPDLAISTFEVPPGQDDALEVDDETQTPILILRSVPADRIENWRFRAVTEGAGLGNVHDTGQIAFWDYDQDGAIDLLTGGGVWSPFRLFRNRGHGFFEAVTVDLGIGEVSGVLSMAPADLDSDGHEDLALGMADGSPNRVFLNRGGDSFRDVTGAGGFGILQSSSALGAADFDGDGDLELLAAGDWTRGALFENPGFENHAWLALDLEGVTANRAAIGARITLIVRDRDWILHRIERVAGGSRIDIGLGEAAEIESLEIQWPVIGWPVSRFGEVPLNRLIRIREGGSKVEAIDRKPCRLGGGDGPDKKSAES